MARKRASLGCLFWLALVLLVLVVVLFNRSAVQAALESTELLTLLGIEGDGEPPRITLRPRGTATEPPAAEPASKPEPVRVTAPTEPQSDGADESTGQTPAEAQSVRTGRIFFVQVAEDGSIALKGVLRAIAYENAPLTKTLQALLSGPTTAELSRNIISLIPRNSRLLRIFVQDGTAYVDLNEGFRFNSLGREGFEAQVRQLVYSATEFPTVRAVQILIDGQLVEYLGPEGVYVGAPLTRDSLRAQG